LSGVSVLGSAFCSSSSARSSPTEPRHYCWLGTQSPAGLHCWLGRKIWWSVSACRHQGTLRREFLISDEWLTRSGRFRCCVWFRVRESSQSRETRGHPQKRSATEPTSGNLIPQCWPHHDALLVLRLRHLPGAVVSYHRHGVSPRTASASRAFERNWRRRRI